MKEKTKVHKLRDSGYFHKGHLSLMGKRAVAGYLFLLPLILGLVSIFIPSMIDAIVYSFNEIIFTNKGYELEFKGWHYYAKISSDVWYINELKNTAIKLAYNVPLITFFSFFMAVLLNQDFKGRTAARAVLFLPVIVAAGCIIRVENTDALAQLVESGDTVDAINSLDITNFLIGIGIPPTICETLSNIMGRIYDVISQSGVQILIFLSALQTIPASLYEASTVEGATAWESFWKITFPMLSPYILTNVVYTIVDAATSYESPFMKIIDSVSSDISAGIAFSIIFFAVIAAILAVCVLLISRLVFYYD